MPVQLYCPSCRSLIRSEHINVNNDLAKCESCHSVMRVSDMLDGALEQQEEAAIVSPGPVRSTPPDSSRIRMDRDLRNTLTIKLPRAGISLKTLPMLFFSAIWLGFITIWTLLAYMGSGGMALFSIPFWFVGLVLLLGGLNKLLVYEYVKVDKNAIHLHRKGVLGSKSEEVPLRDIEAVELRELHVTLKDILSGAALAGGASRRSGGRKRYTPPPNVPTLVTEKAQFQFFLHATKEEHAWVARFLQSLLEKARERSLQY